MMKIKIAVQTMQKLKDYANMINQVAKENLN